MMKKILMSLIVVFVITNLRAQIVPTGDYRSMGLGGGYMFLIDDAAINTNASMLGLQSKDFKHKWAFNLKDFNFSTSSPIIDFGIQETRLWMDDEGPYGEYGEVRSLLVPMEAFTSYNSEAGGFYTYDTTVTRSSRADYQDALSKSNTFRMKHTIIGATYVSEGYGTFSFNVSKETAMKIELSDRLAELFAFGKTSSYFDTLVLVSGTHVANDSNAYNNATLNDVYLAFSNDSLTFRDLLNGSKIEFVRTRNYSFGWGNQIQVANPNYELFVGANLNVIEGLSYFSLKSTDDGISLASFGNGTLPTSNFTNAGMGASVSLSATMDLKDKWLLSASVNDIGFINWKDKSRSGAYGMYSAGGSFSAFDDYYYGTSDSVYFEDQWGEAVDQAFDNSEEGEDRVVTATPITTYFGVRRDLGEHFSLGLDVLKPINPQAPGSMENTMIGLNFALLYDRFNFFGGINNGNNNQVALPLGISFGSQKSKWEFGVSVADVLGFFNSDKTNNYSLGTGLKYRIN